MNEIERRTYLTWASLPSFRRRVERSREIIRDAATRGRIAVATSWGKDSVAMCHLVLDTVGRVPLMHLASVDMPGYEATIEHFSSRAEVINIPAPMTLAQYIEFTRSVGLPHERSRSNQSRVVGKFKRTIGHDWAVEHGYIQALGLRIAEGGERAKVLCSRGPTYAIADGTIKTNPLAYWSARDVWAFIVANELPYNRRIYDAQTHGMTRERLSNTGWLSTNGAGWGRIAWLRAHFPQQYRRLIDEFPHVATLS